jgi:chitodextrinase
MSLMGAWDAATGTFKHEFSPVTQARRGFGPWAIFVDSRGNLWTGGDYSYSIRAGEVNQWSGGFVRFAPRDATAPTTPGNFAQATTASTATLSWGASTDAAGAVQYELIRDNKVIETTSARQLVVPREDDTVRYFVRAVDTSGNRSASSQVLVVQAGSTSTPPAAPTVSGTALDSTSVQLTWNSVAEATEYRVSRNGSQVGVVTAPTTTFTDTGLTAATTYNYSVIAVNSVGQQSTPGTTSVATSAASTNVEMVASLSSWKWRFDSAPWPADWRERTFDDSSWRTGSAVLGWNTAGLGTDITVGVPDPRPLGAQFRHTFNVDDPSAITTARVSVLANDGVVVYVNGTEVGRANMPTGALTQNSFATAAPRSTTAAAARVTMNVPVALLVAGNNVVAASSHSNYRSTPDMSFDLSLVGTP